MCARGRTQGNAVRGGSVGGKASQGVTSCGCCCCMCCTTKAHPWTRFAGRANNRPVHSVHHLRHRSAPSHHQRMCPGRVRCWLRAGSTWAARRWSRRRRRRWAPCRPTCRSPWRRASGILQTASSESRARRAIYTALPPMDREMVPLGIEKFVGSAARHGGVVVVVIIGNEPSTNAHIVTAVHKRPCCAVCVCAPAPYTPPPTPQPSSYPLPFSCSLL